ncbi:MAG: putative oxidoreductase C-terminal domain-containing protein [Gemmatimonadaceae bacterium]
MNRSIVRALPVLLFTTLGLPARARGQSANAVGTDATISVSAQTARPPVARAESARFRLLTLDPGHFHASLVQKFMYADVDSVVRVYSTGGDDLAQHLARIETFNKRTDQPTHWVEKVYTGPDYFERMLAERAGNVVVIAGNNARKTEYIARSIDAGLNVLADKPMIRTPDDLVKLRRAFKSAEAKHVLLYDIMTERNEVTTALQRELSMQPALFGTLVKGTPKDPAISKVSVHHFSKIVAGSPLKRPEWFFDVRQQGEGIVDVTTHLVDLVQWEAFPGETLKQSDVQMLGARRWTTAITPAQFKQVTGADRFPNYLAHDVKNGALQVYSNGEMNYRLRGVNARVSVTWNFEAPAGTGDTHFSTMRGTKANLVIRQGAEQKYKPVLYVERNPSVTSAEHEAALAAAIERLQGKWPGAALRREGAQVAIDVPTKFDVGHESHFAQVTTDFLRYLREGKLPAWEVPNMLVKYGTIMQAYALSRAKTSR